MPAVTFWVSASFCLANSFAFSSLRNVSVAREKARFAGDILFCSNETYQVSWRLTAMGVLAGNEIASSFRLAAATRHRVAWTRSAAAVTAGANWPLPPSSQRRLTPFAVARLGVLPWMTDQASISLSLATWRRRGRRTLKIRHNEETNALFRPQRCPFRQQSAPQMIRHRSVQILPMSC